VTSSEEMLARVEAFVSERGNEGHMLERAVGVPGPWPRSTLREVLAEVEALEADA